MAWAEQMPNGRWRGLYRDADGRKRSSTGDGTKNSWPNRKLALKWAQTQEVDIDRGGWRDPVHAKILFGAWVETWWSDHGPTMDLSNRDTPQGRIKQHLKPRWEDVPLGKITTSGVRAWATQLRKDGHSEATVTAIVGLFSSCLKAAAADGMIGRNPADGVKLIRPTHVEVDVVYTVEQLDLIVAEMDEYWGLITQTLAWTGLRWGELAGLHVPKVNFPRGLIEVRHTFIQRPGLLYVKDCPKDEDVRWVPIPEHLAPALGALAREQGHPASCRWDHRRRDRLRPCSGGSLLFTDWVKARADEPAGYLSRHHYQRYEWRSALKAANEKIAKANRSLTPEDRSPLIPVGRPYDLRHFFATQMAEQGMPVYDLALILGHENVETTRRRYFPEAGIKSHHDRARAATRGALAAGRAAVDGARDGADSRSC